MQFVLALRVFAPWVIGGPAPMSSGVEAHPNPADVLKDLSVQAWHVSTREVGGHVHEVCRRGLEVVLSVFCPSRMGRPWAVAAVNRLEMRCRLRPQGGCLWGRTPEVNFFPRRREPPESIVAASDHGVCQMPRPSHK